MLLRVSQGTSKRWPVCFQVSWHGREVQKSITQCSGQQVGNPGGQYTLAAFREGSGSSSSVLGKDCLSLASWMPLGLAPQSWPVCSVTTVASSSGTLGGKEEAGSDLEGLVAGWQAVLSALPWLGCAMSLRLFGSGDCVQMPIVCPSAGSRARRERSSGSI